MSEDLIKLGALAAHRLLAGGELTSFQLVGAAARRIIEPRSPTQASQRTVAL
jgi:hypothetical protein